MFNVTENRTFTHVVKVKTPVDGGYETETLKATFNLISVEEAEAFDLRVRDGTTAFLLRVVNKLDDLADAKKQPVTYSDKVRDFLFGQPHVRQALATGYFEAVANEGPKKGN